MSAEPLSKRPKITGGGSGSKSNLERPVTESERPDSSTWLSDERLSIPTDFYDAFKESMPNVQKVEDRHIICVYDCDDVEEIMPSTYPDYIKLGQVGNRKDTNMTEVPIQLIELGNDNTLTLPPLTLSEEQENQLEKFFGIAEIMLDGLTLGKNIWEDKTSVKERMARCGSGLNAQFHRAVFLFYNALTSGFYDWDSTNAMSAIVSALEVILDMDESFNYHACISMGGRSVKNEGVAEILKLPVNLKSLNEEEQLKLITQHCKITQANVKCFERHVPDFVLMKGTEKRNYLFGECKSKYSKLGTTEELQWQTWIQSLCGLLNSDEVYACGTNSSVVIFLKVSHIYNNCKASMDVKKLTFPLAKQLGKKFIFNINNFKKAIKSLLTIMMDG